ncbi:O-antigen ligase family protein [Terracidiphilus gabretensis]|uniref:O-antigen ligase family protein n=1 Tax=Terracidiphilus gabretensis TaxID=1577687 RepID=UPI00071B525D|nr:O-antigen ligase family protein [Terracidiphilus gabretensis]
MRSAAWALMVIFTFAVPWEYSLDFGEPVGNVARVAGVLLLFFMIPAALQAGRLRTPKALQWLVMALFLWWSCSAMWSIDTDATLDRLRGAFQVMMSVWLLWELVEKPEDLRILLRAYVAGACVLAALTLANFASPDTADQARFVAEGQDPNDVARFLDLGLPIAALLLNSERRWWARLLALGYLPLGFLCVLLTGSREGLLAGLLALAGGAVVLFRRRPERLGPALFCVPLLIALIWAVVPEATLDRLATIPEQMQGGDLNQRLNIWTAGWQAFVRRPLFGSGAGTFVAAAGLAPIDTAHNTLLSLVVEGGIVELTICATIVAACVGSVRRMAGTLRIGMGTALAVWCLTLLAATVEQNRTTWVLLGLIACAGRLAVEAPDETARCFSTGSELHSAHALAEPA